LTVHIEAVHLGILAVGLLVGYVTYKITHVHNPLGHGDIVGAIGAAVGVITVLMLICGDAKSEDGQQKTPPTSAVLESTPTPPGNGMNQEPSQ
jgi:hypothetical protein